MFVILGSTGHVGSAVTRTLLEQGEAVTVVTRDGSRAEPLRRLGAKVVVADLNDVAGMRGIFRTGTRLFLLNPPAAPDTDTDAVEKRTARLLLDAIHGSGLEKIVAQSTIGAQPGERLGDLSTLWSMEEGLRSQPIPHSILRSAYYMSNWDAMLAIAREQGVLPTMYPADLEFPMVSPLDLGRVAADLLKAHLGAAGIHYVEGPERYSARDVAAAFARALGRKIEPVATPRAEWERAYRKLGFSEAAAQSYARMTAIGVDGDYDMPEETIRGTVTLQTHVDALAGA